MHILIFSDTHFSTEFDQPRYDALVDVISGAEKVIINGDFFDAYLCKFGQFINSQWSQLFPLLKKKKAIYIYGNHDKPEYLDERVTLFSVEQTYRKELTVNGKKFIIQHGHTLGPDFDGQFPRISHALSWFYPKYVYHLEHKTWINRLFLSKMAGSRFVMIDEDMKSNIQHMRKVNPDLENVTMVCGHSHLLQYNDELKYANSGWFRRGMAQYVTIQKSGTIRIVDGKY